MRKSISKPEKNLQRNTQTTLGSSQTGPVKSAMEHTSRRNILGAGRRKSVEVAIIEAESRLDGLSQHVHRHRCIPNPVQQEIFKTLGAIRIARDNLRWMNGNKQWTMIAVPGGGKSADYNKKWRFKPVGTRFKCSVERGLKADCWYCKETFRKTDECSKCQFFICPHCGKCACNLTTQAREAVEITMKAIFGPSWRKLSSTMGEA